MLQRVEILASFPLFARRVVQQDFHAQLAAYLRHLASYIAYADNSQRLACQPEVFFLLKQEEGGLQVLCHRGGVASRCVLPRDARLAAIFGVDVVETDGGRGYETHAASFQQLAVTPGAGADNERVGIFHQLRGKVLAGRVNHFVDHVGQCFSYIRYFIVYDYFHCAVLSLNVRKDKAFPAERLLHLNIFFTFVPSIHILYAITMKEFLQLLRRFVPPYKKYLGWALFLNLLSAFLNIFSFTLIIPILQILFEMDTKVYEFIPWDTAGMGMKDIVVNNFYYSVSELIAEQGPSLTLLILGVFLAVMTLLKTLAYFASSAVMIPLRTGIVRDIRMQVYNKVLRLPLAFFSEERKGDIIARMSGDVTEVETSVTSSLDMLIKNPILIIVYFGTLIAVSWQLTLFTLLVVPAMGWVMGTVGKKLKRKSLEAQDKWSDTMSQLEETLGGLRIIKAFLAEGKMAARFDRCSNEYRDAINRVATRQALAHPMSEFLGTCLIVIVLWFGGTLDLLIQINDKVYIVDFKTSNHISSNYFLQLGGYKYLVENDLGVNVNGGVIVLQLNKNEIGFDEYILLNDNPEHYEFIEKSVNGFLSLVYAYYHVVEVDNCFKRAFQGRDVV